MASVLEGLSNAFTVNSGGTNSNYGATSGQAIYVGNSPALYVPGNAGRVAPIRDLWSQSTYSLDLALKRVFPLYRSMSLAIGIDMTDVANHVVYKGPGTTVAAGSPPPARNIHVIINRRKLKVTWMFLLMIYVDQAESETQVDALLLDCLGPKA